MKILKMFLGISEHGLQEKTSKYVWFKGHFDRHSFWRMKRAERETINTFWQLNEEEKKQKGKNRVSRQNLGSTSHIISKPITAPPTRKAIESTQVSTLIEYNIFKLRIL